jgi:hypothetical protein
MPDSCTWGQMAADGLFQAIHDFKIGPILADRNRHILSNVNHRGDLIGRSLDDVLAEASQVLLESGRVYRFGNEIVFEVGQGEDAALVSLAVRGKAESGAEALLSNLMAVASGDGETSIQAGFPQKMARILLADEMLWSLLPPIRFYGHRPVFDQDFGLCGPGYHADSGILVHGPAITPVLYEPPNDPTTSPIDRLPPRLRELLAEFCWRSNADLVNTVAYLLEGLLVNHFVHKPHPVATVDGNQPSIGKTLVVQAVACILDGLVPKPIELSGDEELSKRLGAEIRNGSSTVILLDNVRGRLASAVVEANALSPILSFRILGHSATIERPNSYLWAVTSNGTEASSDLISRSLPIRLFFEGDPKKREFSADVLEYSLEHRLEILGELAGMVQRWLQYGNPPGYQRHRCREWAFTIGGILDVAGLGEHFLANADEAAADMDEGIRELTALAGHVVKRGDDQQLLYYGQAGSGEPGRLPADWVPIFDQARLLQDKLSGANEHSRSTAVGMFLGARIDRSVVVETDSQSLHLTLRKRVGRSRKKYYYFEVKDSQKSDEVVSAGPDESDVQAVIESQAVPCTASGTGAPGPSGGSGARVAGLEWC